LDSLEAVGSKESVIGLGGREGGEDPGEGKRDLLWAGRGGLLWAVFYRQKGKQGLTCLDSRFDPLELFNKMCLYLLFPTQSVLCPKIPSIADIIRQLQIFPTKKVFC
jgi:hypothetical protein